MKLRDDARTRRNNLPCIGQHKRTLNTGYHAELPAIIGITDRLTYNDYEFT